MQMPGCNMQMNYRYTLKTFVFVGLQHAFLMQRHSRFCCNYFDALKYYMYALFCLYTNTFFYLLRSNYLLDKVFKQKNYSIGFCLLLTGQYALYAFKRGLCGLG